VAAWRGPAGPDGFAPNLSVVHTPGSSPRGDDLAVEVVENLLDHLDERRLIDVHLDADDDLRLVVTHRVARHRLTLLQRVLVHAQGSVTVTVTVPDLQVAALRDTWASPLRTFSRQAVTA
jgi:hypothetical protein